MPCRGIRQNVRKAGAQTAALLLAVAFVGSAGAREAERHPVLGLILDVDRPHHTIVVSHQEIPGVMEAMVMPFVVREPKELDGLEANVLVDFVVAVEKDALYAENVRRHEFTSADPQPQNAARMKLLESLTSTGPTVQGLEIGDPVPDFKLIDQKSQPVVFSQLSGKVVALSFMYTKCRLANYCFRLSNNLGVVQRRFHERLGKDLVLLTITFDPANDEPEGLAKYAATWKADPRTWHFLTGAVPEVRRVCHMFGMNFWPDMGMITHTLRTVVVDREGRVAANLEGNEFTPQQLGDLVESVMNRKSRASTEP
jgi:protein SCO1